MCRFDTCAKGVKLSFLINEQYKNELVDLIGNIDSEALGVLAFHIITAKHVYLIGNGGSLCNAMHGAEDLLKVTGICAHVPVDMSLLTATANDTGYENSFALALKAHATKDDVLIAISGSGNSPNIVRACMEFPGFKIGLLGNDGGKIKGLVNEAIIVETNNMRLIEDVHCVILHMILNAVHENGLLKGRE